MKNPNIAYVSLGIIVTAAAPVGFALYTQYFEGLVPCPLCMVQRWAYAVAAACGFMALVAARFYARMAGWAVIAAGLAFLGGSAIAFYHVGVEQHWWASVMEGCTASFDPNQDLLTQIQSRKVARCDEIAWSLFGFSMAAWNMALSLTLGLATMLAGIRLLRRARA